MKPLKGVRVLSLALNLPGPAALMRCRDMGARGVKLEPPAPPGALQGTTGDPMSYYNPKAYGVMHTGIRTVVADLKTDKGQKTLHCELAKADVLLTSFRPSALVKLGLNWRALHRQYPQLSQITIIGAPGQRAEEAGHDLTYLAENDLVAGLNLPPTLFADMSGSLMTSEAVLKAVMLQRRKAKGVQLEVALSNAAAWLALPRSWGLTQPDGTVGGAHAGYRIYPCKEGRVAVAALEPHFATRLCVAAGIPPTGADLMLAPATYAAVAAFMLSKTRSELETLALTQDIPLHTLAV